MRDTIISFFQSDEGWDDDYREPEPFRWGGIALVWDQLDLAIYPQHRYSFLDPRHIPWRVRQVAEEKRRSRIPVVRGRGR